MVATAGGFQAARLSGFAVAGGVVVTAGGFQAARLCRRG